MMMFSRTFHHSTRIHGCLLRLAFGLIGSAGCLFGALLSEVVFALGHLENALEQHGTPCLLFSSAKTANQLLPFSQSLTSGFWHGFAITTIWGGLLTLALVAALSLSIDWYLYRQVNTRDANPIKIAQSVGIGCVAGAIGQMAYVMMPIPASRSLEIALLAGLIAFASCRVIDQLPRRLTMPIVFAAVLAGTLALYFSSKLVPNWWNRLEIAAVSGFAIGMLVTFRKRMVATNFVIAPSRLTRSNSIGREGS